MHLRKSPDHRWNMYLLMLPLLMWSGRRNHGTMEGCNCQSCSTSRLNASPSIPRPHIHCTFQYDPSARALELISVISFQLILQQPKWLTRLYHTQMTLIAIQTALEATGTDKSFSSLGDVARLHLPYDLLFPPFNWTILCLSRHIRDSVVLDTLKCCSR